MGRNDVSFQEVGDVAADAVVRAWVATGHHNRQAASIQIMADRKGRNPNRKSTVYRIVGAGPDGTNVIAKHARADRLRRELHVYQVILPAARLSSVRCHGYVEDGGGTHGWLFLQEAIGARYEESDPEHRAAASDWIARLHVRTSCRPDLGTEFPTTGAALFRGHLAYIADQIRATDAISLPEAGWGVLKAIASQCLELDHHWSAIAEFCDRLPRCVVHGDVISKNARVGGIDTPQFLVLDWDEVRWGIPVADVAGLDPARYAAAVHPVWIEFDEELVVRVEAVGRLFRTLDWIGTLVRWLSADNLDWMLDDLIHYEDDLRRARHDSSNK
jgi:hypothetical protein